MAGAQSVDIHFHPDEMFKMQEKLSFVKGGGSPYLSTNS
jgi:hypothetical protein